MERKLLRLPERPKEWSKLYLILIYRDSLLHSFRYFQVTLSNQHGEVVSFHRKAANVYVLIMMDQESRLLKKDTVILGPPAKKWNSYVDFLLSLIFFHSSRRNSCFALVMVTSNSFHYCGSLLLWCYLNE